MFEIWLRKMSLLGPDDFDLSRKERTKKLAKDLSPAVRKSIEDWLERLDDDEAFKKISKILGPEKARQIVAKRRNPLRD
jgi:uncharacterized damage-inducible protein DinB